MRIHEYQAKEILSRYGVPMPEGRVVREVEEALETAESLGGYPLAVKAQVPGSRRARAGGIRIARNAEEVRKYADAMLGSCIAGGQVDQLLIERNVNIAREMFVAITIDRSRRMPVLIVSGTGGMDVEEVLATEPQHIQFLPIQPGLGICDFQIRQARYFLDIGPDSHAIFERILRSLEQIMLNYDAMTVEINPLVLDQQDRMIACDVTLEFDENALPLHGDIEALREAWREPECVTKARELGMTYVGLQGRIGCLVNGGGLGMAVADLVADAGGEAAALLDIGSRLQAELIAEALRLLASDESVRVVLICIFGGLVRCDRIVEAILTAGRKHELKVPMVACLTGANEDQAMDKTEGTALILKPSIGEAAAEAVRLGPSDPSRSGERRGVS